VGWLLSGGSSKLTVAAKKARAISAVECSAPNILVVVSQNGPVVWDTKSSSNISVSLLACVIRCAHAPTSGSSLGRRAMERFGQVCKTNGKGEIGCEMARERQQKLCHSPINAVEMTPSTITIPVVPYKLASLKCRSTPYLIA
jgi:hypothetical protein